MTARGVLHVHSCPPALCPHVTWAVARELGVRVDLPWSNQPVLPGTVRTELTFTARVGTAGQLASALKGWAPLRFETVELPSSGNDGRRYSFTGRLGLFAATTSANGDIMVGEDRLRAARERGADLGLALDALLGAAWDAELEPFRQAAYGTPAAQVAQVG